MTRATAAPAIDRTSPAGATFVARAPELRRHWNVVLTAHLAVAYGLVGLGASYTLGSFIRPLSEAFGWTRAEIQGVTLIMPLGSMAGGMVAGWLADRIGARPVIIWSLAGFGLCFIAIGTFVHSLFDFYGLYLLMSFIGAGTLPVTSTRAIAVNFNSQRGLAIGLALSGAGLCAVTVPGMLSYVIGNHGWRLGYVATGLLPLLIALPAAMIFLPRGASDRAAAGASAPACGQAGDSLATALRSSRFWIIGVALALASGAATGFLTSLAPWLQDIGSTTETAALTSSASER